MARIIHAFTQFFDDNGDPLIDGLLQFYESGTNNTDKDTFADGNETITNTNPVVLDGAGRCPNIFGTGSYNVISFTSSLVQVQQFDPVNEGAALGAFSAWTSTTIYSEGDIVTGSDGAYYRSIGGGNQNNDPISSVSDWEEVRLMGVYNVNLTYSANDLVIDVSGHIYRSLVGSNLNNTPADNPDKWGDPTNIADLTTSTLTHNMTSNADYTLSVAENLEGRLIVTDTSVVLTAGRNIIVSDVERTIFVQNDTLQGLTFKTAAGTGIAVLAGDTSIVLCDGTNIVEPIDISTGTIVQIQRTDDGEVSTGTTTIPNDDNIPDKTEGDEYMTVTITPKFATSKLIIEAQVHGAMSTTTSIMGMALFQDATGPALKAIRFAKSTSSDAAGIGTINHEMIAGTTSLITFKINAGRMVASGTFTFNGNSGTRFFGGVMNSFIKVTEIAQ